MPVCRFLTSAPPVCRRRRSIGMRWRRWRKPASCWPSSSTARQPPRSSRSRPRLRSLRPGCRCKADLECGMAMAHRSQVGNHCMTFPAHLYLAHWARLQALHFNTPFLVPDISTMLRQALSPLLAAPLQQQALWAAAFHASAAPQSSVFDKCVPSSLKSEHAPSPQETLLPRGSRPVTRSRPAPPSLQAGWQGQRQGCSGHGDRDGRGCSQLGALGRHAGRRRATPCVTRALFVSPATRSSTTRSRPTPSPPPSLLTST